MDKWLIHGTSLDTKYDQYTFIEEKSLRCVYLGYVKESISDTIIINFVTIEMKLDIQQTEQRIFQDQCRRLGWDAAIASYSCSSSHVILL